MANYIDDEILCEGYTRFNIDLINDPVALEELRQRIIAYMQVRANFLLGDEVKVVVEFEEGSLKSTVKVIGSAVVVISAAIANYGSFSGGIKQAAEDATMLAQAANLEMIFQTKTASCDRLRLESRKGILGRVEDLLSSLAQIKRVTDQAEIPRKASEQRAFRNAVNDLLTWETKSDKLLGKITDVKTKACIAAGLAEELEKFADDPSWTKQLNSKGLGAAIIAADTSELAKISQLATQYSVVIKSLRKKMMVHVAEAAPQKS